MLRVQVSLVGGSLSEISSFSFSDSRQPNWQYTGLDP